VTGRHLPQIPASPRPPFRGDAGQTRRTAARAGATAEVEGARAIAARRVRAIPRRSLAWALVDRLGRGVREGSRLVLAMLFVAAPSVALGLALAAEGAW
jgi:hypothetical protein